MSQRLTMTCMAACGSCATDTSNVVVTVAAAAAAVAFACLCCCCRRRSYKESNHLVMHPLPSGTLNMLFERGRRDALAWVQHSSLTTELVQQLKARNQWQQQQQQQQQQPVAQQPAAALDAPSSTAQAAGTQAEAAPVLGGVAAEGSSNPKGVREGDAAVALLHMHVDELPLLLPVPQDLLHFL